MKRLPFVVKPYGDAQRPNLKFIVEGNAAGKRQRKFFENEREAKTFAHLRNTELLKYGTDAGISMPLRAMARECEILLDPFGKTIRDATQHFLAYLEQNARSCTLPKLFAEVAAAKRLSQFSPQYARNFELLGKLFAAAFPDKLAAAISTRDVNDFLAAKKTRCAVSYNHWRRLLGVVFKHAKDAGYCVENPVIKALTVKEVPKPAGILRPEELARLLAAASPDILPALAIGAFAGLRTAELTRLDWREVNLESGYIEVTAANAKSSRRRLVKIQPCLAEWLRPIARKAGPVGLGPCMFCGRRQEAMARAGLADWPKNGLRHSFASYHVAHFKDAAALALEMGHTTTELIFSNYREMVTPAAAAEYWQIAPFSRSETGQVFAFTAAAYPWHLSVFGFDEEFVEGPSELAEYFGVHVSNVNYWFKNPHAPARQDDNRFHVATWLAFVLEHTRADVPAGREWKRPFAVGDSLTSATHAARKFFNTEAEARAYADERNRDRLAKEVNTAELRNVLEFPKPDTKGKADIHAKAV